MLIELDKNMLDSLVIREIFKVFRVVFGEFDGCMLRILGMDEQVS